MLKLGKHGWDVSNKRFGSLGVLVGQQLKIGNK